MSNLPIVKDKQLIRLLKKLGFFEHHQRGTSHLIMAHQDGRRTTISIHPGKDIPRGTLKGILKDLEISTEEFLQLLYK
ncbi:MAG: type II toxin-antitoxin system HicA family toxin [Candidatus Wildermuthbacteria bacterium]|nr:type II toxin-antitoxin system HicA family toxin [Candidatus Wildermuthbacteria bacterium]